MNGEDRPSNVNAERAVLGAMLLRNRDGGRVIADLDPVLIASTILTAEDFYREPHAEVFTVVRDLWDANQPHDAVAVAAALQKRKSLLRVGGAPYLHELIADVPTVTNVGYYAELVADCAARTRLLETAQRIQELARQGGKDETPEVLDRARELMDLATVDRATDDEDEGAWIADTVDEVVASWHEPDEPGLPLPFADLDGVVNGFKPGQLILIAARPGIGKSAVATDIIRYAAEHRNRYASLLVSLEMPRAEVIKRMVSAKAKVRAADIDADTWTDHEKTLVDIARAEMHKLPIKIVDRHAVSMARLRALAREMKRSDSGLHLIVVDYVQLLTPADPKLPRREQVDSFSRGLKSLAKELEVPVVALAQLNRGPEQRTDKKPMLSDLRESGALEQDADIVILIHRPDAFERDDPRAGEADLILAKHRGGPTATIPIAHQLHYSRFADLARGAA